MRLTSFMAAGLVAMGVSLVATTGCAAPGQTLSPGVGNGQVTAEQNAVKVAAELLSASARDVSAQTEQLEASLARVDVAVTAAASIRTDAAVIATKVGQINNAVGGGDNNNVTTWMTIGGLILLIAIQMFKGAWRWQKARTLDRIIQQGGSR